MDSKFINPRPVEVRRLGEQGLFVAWSDGSNNELSSESLRRNCPCATCREERGESAHDTPLSKPPPQKKKSLAIIQNSLSEQIQLLKIWGVGNYAIGMQWGDGHATGIYTFELLWRLCSKSA